MTTLTLGPRSGGAECRQFSPDPASPCLGQPCAGLSRAVPGGGAAAAPTPAPAPSRAPFPAVPDPGDGGGAGAGVPPAAAAGAGGVSAAGRGAGAPPGSLRGPSRVPHGSLPGPGPRLGREKQRPLRPCEPSRARSRCAPAGSAAGPWKGCLRRLLGRKALVFCFSFPLLTIAFFF